MDDRRGVDVYRYFESSEAVLLTVLVEEFVQWHGELRTALNGSRTIEHIGRAFAAAAYAHSDLAALRNDFGRDLEDGVLTLLRGMAAR